VEDFIFACTLGGVKKRKKGKRGGEGGGNVSTCSMLMDFSGFDRLTKKRESTEALTPPPFHVPPSFRSAAEKIGGEGESEERRKKEGKEKYGISLAPSYYLYPACRSRYKEGGKSSEE